MNPEFTLHAIQCCLHFDKPKKNEIHSVNEFQLSVIYRSVSSGLL